MFNNRNTDIYIFNKIIVFIIFERAKLIWMCIKVYLNIFTFLYYLKKQNKLLYSC